MHPLVCTIALAVGLAMTATAGRAATAELTVAETASRPTQWTLSYDGKPLMEYICDPQKYKPCVHQLNTLAGYGVLRDAPHDHLHHHALMYGIKVNGINFWEEISGSGVQKVVESSPPATDRSPAGLPRARLTQVLYWLAPEDAFLPNTNAPALLIERRTLLLTVNPDQRETAVHWQSVFEVGPKTNTVVLTGSTYHGLGMRFLQELDPVAVHFTLEGKPDLSNNRQDVTVHPWEAIAFNSPTKPATIALFSGPKNARGDAHFFAMKTPFAYISATQGLDKEPLVYRRGNRFELNYLVTLYPEIKTAEALSQRDAQWRTSGE